MLRKEKRVCIVLAVYKRRSYFVNKNKSQTDLGRSSDLPGTAFNESYYDW